MTAQAQGCFFTASSLAQYSYLVVGPSLVLGGVIHMMLLLSSRSQAPCCRREGTWSWFRLQLLCFVCLSEAYKNITQQLLSTGEQLLVVRPMYSAQEIINFEHCLSDVVCAREYELHSRKTMVIFLSDCNKKCLLYGVMFDLLGEIPLRFTDHPLSGWIRACQVIIDIQTSVSKMSFSATKCPDNDR